MDAAGLAFGISSFLIVGFCIFLLLEKYDLNRAIMLKLVGICGIGHFLGGLLYFWFNAHYGTDTEFYWENATTTFSGTGYYFAFFVLGYLRTYLVGDSILAVFLIFAALAFLGSIFYLLTFKILLDRLCDGQKYYLVDPKILYLPALLLLCWPSYFFWNVGLKDNFAFLSLSMFFFILVQNRITLPLLGMFFISFTIGFMVRPYLVIILGCAAIYFVLFGSKWHLLIKILLLLIIFYVASPLISQFSMYGKVSSSFDTFTNYAIQQQRYMNIGTSIPLPTENPRLLFFFLPYLFLINLFLPLLIGATNWLGIIGSFENLYFLSWVFFFMRNRIIWNQVKNKLKITIFFIQFFLVGMGFLSLMNTNLGLAMREKAMFVPALWIIIFLVYAYQRIQVLKYRISLQSKFTIDQLH